MRLKERLAEAIDRADAAIGWNPMADMPNVLKRVENQPDLIGF
jgi:hypothetical protein